MPPRGGNPANLPLLGRSELVKQGDCAIFRLRRSLRTRRQIVVRRHYNNFAGLWQGNSPTEPQPWGLDPLPGRKFLFFKGRGGNLTPL